MRVVIGTGGTAGHIFPALVTAEHLRDGYGAEIVFVGTGTGQEARLVPAAGFELRRIEAMPFHRGLSLRAIGAPFAALRGAKLAREFIRGSDAVLGMGGYVSVPVSVAANREKVPLVIHEQNAVLGLANRLAARWASVIGLSFPEAGRHLPRSARAVTVGNPVRASIVAAAERTAELRAQARAELELEEGRTTILIFGGSQGAIRLNRAAIELAGLLRDREDMQLLIVTGPRNHAELQRHVPTSGALRVHAVAFLERIELAYSVADLAVARAGAMTIAELTACGVPAILVPYPYATANHQEANARAVERAGGAVVLLDEQTNGAVLARTIDELARWQDRLPTMARASRAFGKPGAADALAGLVVSAAGRG